MSNLTVDGRNLTEAERIKLNADMETEDKAPLAPVSTSKSRATMPTALERLAARPVVEISNVRSWDRSDTLRKLAEYDRETLLVALCEAIEEIEYWSSHASDYFHQKHSLDATLKGLRTVVDTIETSK